MPQIADVLIVEDDPDWLEIYSAKLVSEEYKIIKARTVRQASKLLAQQEFAVVATDLKLLGADTGGFDILEMVREGSSDAQVIIFTGVGGKQDAFEAMHRGAYDYVTKPLDYDHVKRVIKSAIDAREQKLSYRRNLPRSREVDLPFPENFVGSSQTIKRVLIQVATIIESARPVLILGASGTGKALIAETIHLASKRKRFVLVNCASFSETTLIRTLFGCQKGALPYAFEDEAGLLEQASGGTLVLDRVSELSPRLQGELYNTLSANPQHVRRFGSTRAIDIDLRVLATSRVDLKTYVAQGLFSEKLYDYLSDSVIELPPLKERKDGQTDDVLLLAGYFLDKYARGKTISEEAMGLLQTYDFPGNVRELEEAIRVASAKAKSDKIEPQHWPERIQNQSPPRDSWPQNSACPHGYSLTAQANLIAQKFDAKKYVYLSLGPDRPAWHEAAVTSALTPFDLKPYDGTNSVSDSDFCPVCGPILSSQLAILDISTANPATFYELGLAHAVGLPCAVLKKVGSHVSENLGRTNLLEYRDETSLREMLVVWLNYLNTLSH